MTQKITKNQVEDFPVKATGAEITTGTDDAKFVTPKALADATVGKFGAAWESWTPTLANWAIGTGGSASLVARYMQTGKTIHFVLNATLGTSGQSMGSNPTFTLPTASTSAANQFILQIVIGSTPYTGMAAVLGSVSTTVATIYANIVSGSNVTRGSITATVPATWGAGSIIRISGTYEAA